MTSPRAQERAEVQRLLRSASHVPYDVQRGLERHQQLIDNQAALPDWANEVPPAGSSWRSWAVVGALGAIILSGVLLLGRAAQPTNEAAPMVAAAPAVTTQAPLAPHVEPIAQQAEPSRAPDVPSSTPLMAAASDGEAAQPREGVVAPASAMTMRATRTRAASHQRANTSVRRAAAVPSVNGSADAPQATSAPSSALATKRATQPDPGAQANGTQQPDVEAEQPEVLIEMEQLKTAERLLKQQPQRTLALVRAGFERFRPGYLNQERRYLEVMALLQMGKVDDAKLLGRVFIHDYPTGPYRRKVEQALAEH